MQIGKFPRVRLASLPTPLMEMSVLTEKLGGPRILVKRDDLTGLAFGGNKTRKLEFIMGDAKRRTADVVVTGAGFQSNWCTQTAAAARKLGMEVVLIKTGPKVGYDPEEYDGNHLLHHILGAEIRITTSVLNTEYEEIAHELKKKGHNPYVIPLAGSTSAGVLGYANCVLELLSQANDIGVKIDYIILASGSGGTQAGLTLGAKALNSGIKVLGISISRGKEDLTNVVASLVDGGSKLLGIDLEIGEGDITVLDDYLGGGYGIISDEVVEAIRLVAETEGIFLDPVYTGKAMVALINLTEEGYFTKKDTVVFLHSGGNPVLFPYKSWIKSVLKSERPPWHRPPWAGKSQL